ncbi:MAG: hypothetical protein A3H27_16970 [Acidobacteria bacterium RIFCSPLOWO2_02_FULL_59_13]|nr:MAG: hypothetical protein A3H27_16970 [Acidobacteria bacterium RIFCSPLOWO2_02_FULL_59_13]
MKALRDWLIIGVLAVGVIVGLQVSYLLVQAGKVLRTAELELQIASFQAQNTMLYAQAVLSSTRQTTEMVRKSAEYQLGYYEAMGRRTSLALAKLNLLIDHTDDRMERLTVAGEAALVAVQDSVDAMSRPAEQLGVVLEAAAKTTAAVGRLAEDPSIPLALSNLETSTESLALASAHTAEATARASEAIGSIRDMVSPAKKSFWRRLLELMIPRPSVNVLR